MFLYIFITEDCIIPDEKIKKKLKDKIAKKTEFVNEDYHEVKVINGMKAHIFSVSKHCYGDINNGRWHKFVCGFEYEQETKDEFWY